MPYIPKRPKITQAPEQIETPQDRGVALRAWLNVRGLRVGDFAINAGISRATLQRYLSGATDIADMQQETADAFLRAMGVADEDAWDILGIPVEARNRFRSFRPFPLGHGPKAEHTPEQQLTLLLEEDLFGTVALPAGTVIRIEQGENQQRHQIYRLLDGRLFAAFRESPVAAPGATLLGGLCGAEFASD